MEETKEEVNSNHLPSSSVDGLTSSSTAEDSTSGLVSQALSAVAALKAENDRRERLLLQEQELYAKRILGGRSEAGSTEKILTPEEKAKEEAKAFLAKVGLNPFK